MREADLDKHITSGQGPEVKDEQRVKEREEAIKKLEDANAKAKDSKDAKDKELPKLPEYGSAEDFRLQQALHRLKGEPVVVSKTLTERKPEDEKVN